MGEREEHSGEPTSYALRKLQEVRDAQESGLPAMIVVCSSVPRGYPQFDSRSMYPQHLLGTLPAPAPESFPQSEDEQRTAWEALREGLASGFALSGLKLSALELDRAAANVPWEVRDARWFNERHLLVPTSQETVYYHIIERTRRNAPPQWAAFITVNLSAERLHQIIRGAADASGVY